MRYDLIMLFPSSARTSFPLCSFEKAPGFQGLLIVDETGPSLAKPRPNPETQILKENSHNTPSGDWPNGSTTLILNIS